MFFVSDFCCCCVQHIDEISVRSSIFNSDVTKLILINFREIHVKKEVRQSSQQNANVDADDVETTTKKEIPFDFRNKKVPSYIITFAQVSSRLFTSHTCGCCL